MAITPELIAAAKEWEIRSLIDAERFPVEGNLEDILTTDQTMERMPKAQDKKFTSHFAIGDAMKSTHSRLRLSITDMAARIDAEGELIVDVESADLGWLRIPGDEDKYHIVLIIRRFLEHQEWVHSQNMSQPSEIEKKDYRILKRIHNHLVEAAERWINRDVYVPVERVKAGEAELDLSIFGGGTGQLEEEEPMGRKTLTAYSEGSAFANLSDSAATW